MRFKGHQIALRITLPLNTRELNQKHMASIPSPSHTFEKSRQARALEGHRGNQSWVPGAVLGKESRAGEGAVFFRSSPSDQ